MAATADQLGYPTGGEVVGIDGLSSVPEAFQATVRRFPDGVAYRTLDDSVRLTWGEVATEVTRWAHALTAVGVHARDTIALMMTNRPEHLVADLGGLHLGAVATSIYNTVPPGDLAYIVGDSGARVLITQAVFVDKIRDAVAAYGLDLDLVVVADDDAPQSIPGVETLSVPAFLQRGEAVEVDLEAARRAVQLEDLCHVIYTSGTTGRPKGVELSHRSALAGAEAYRVAAPVAPGRRLLSAFPLAHAAERAVTYYLPVIQGHCVTFCDDIRRLGEAYLLVRPAYVFMTPRSLERFRAIIDRDIALEPDPERRARCERAVAAGTAVVEAEQRGQEIAPSLVAEWEASAATRAEILASVGLDGVEYAGCGSAPVSLELMSFFIGLGMPAREGWGMTETGGPTAIGRLDQPYRVGFAGPASPGMELALAADGEILVRGAGLMSGYRNDPEATAQAFDADGWFRTGDLGELNDLGQLRMVDRKKELIINGNGKNMSPVKIEAKVKNAGTLVGQIIAVGDSRPFVSALLQLDPEALEVFCRAHGIDPSLPLAALAADDRLRAAVQEQVDRANAELADVEQIRRWRIVTTSWVPGGDELTPTMKLKRRAITTKYAELVDELYR